jgi:hypothetical protein
LNRGFEGKRVPPIEAERLYETETEFERAVRAMLADYKTRVIMATADDGSELGEVELKKQYGLH